MRGKHLPFKHRKNKSGLGGSKASVLSTLLPVAPSGTYLGRLSLLSNKCHQMSPSLLPKGLFLSHQEVYPIICLSFLSFILFGRQKSTTTFTFCIVCIVKNWKINLVSSPNELPIPSGRHSETDFTSNRLTGNSVS